MKAAVLSRVGEPLAIAEVPVPEIAPDEILVETRTCGICRTDLHLQDGLAYVPRLPHIPGHEPAGVVARLGSEVRDLRLGQRVAPHLFVASAECPFTRAGRHAQARHLKGIIGVTLPGGFAEFFAAPARNLLRLPDGVSFEVGGLVSCAGVTAVHAFRRAELPEGTSAVVLGAGGIGLLLVQLLAHHDVHTLAVSRSEQGCRLATAVGASAAFRADEPELDRAISGFAGDDSGGVDCVFDLVGTAATIRSAATWLAPGGRLVVIGEEPETFPLNSIEIAQRELAIVGSRNGGLQDAADALSWMATGVLKPVIAARFPLSQIAEAMQFVRDDRAPGRVVVEVPA